MDFYCKGSHCNKRVDCKLHQIEPNKSQQYIDWSTFGTVCCWTDYDGTARCETQTFCGIEGNHRMFIEVTDETVAR